MIVFVWVGEGCFLRRCFFKTRGSRTTSNLMPHESRELRRAGSTLYVGCGEGIHFAERMGVTLGRKKATLQTSEADRDAMEAREGF